MSLAVALLGVETGIDSVEVFGIQLILRDAERFAETLEVYDFALPEELDGLAHIRLLDQAEDVVVGASCFLLCYSLLPQNR